MGKYDSLMSFPVSQIVLILERLLGGCLLPYIHGETEDNSCCFLFAWISSAILVNFFATLIDFK